MSKWERTAPFDYRKPRSNEELIREVSLKTWNPPKTRPRVRMEYCDKCDCIHGKGKHKTK